MYATKKWNPSDMQKEELKSLLQHPWWIAIQDRAEFEQAEAGKYLLSILQELDTAKPEDMLTLEKEWIKAQAVTKFLETVKIFTNEIYSPQE